MAYEYDRFEKEEGGGSFLMGLLAGTVLGAGLGMLFAPKAGNELRAQLGEQAGRLRTTAEEQAERLRTTANDAYGQATDKVGQIVDRGREAYDRARAGAPTAAGGSDLGTSSTMGDMGSNQTSGPNYTNRG